MTTFKWVIYLLTFAALIGVIICCVAYLASMELEIKNKNATGVSIENKSTNPSSGVETSSVTPNASERCYSQNGNETKQIITIPEQTTITKPETTNTDIDCQTGIPSEEATTKQTETITEQTETTTKPPITTKPKIATKLPITTTKAKITIKSRKSTKVTYASKSSR